MSYRCNTTFVDSTGRRHSQYDEIADSDFDTLQDSEKPNYTFIGTVEASVEEEPTSDGSGDHTPIDPVPVGEGTAPVEQGNQEATN